MNTPKSSHIMTQIKQQNQQKNKRKYFNNRQQRALNYYQQYKDKIVFIQRWYRSTMAAASRKAETLLLAKLHKNQQLELIKQQVTETLMKVSERRTFLMQEKENLALINLEKQIENKLRKAVTGTLQRTEESAFSNGKAKYALSQIQNLRQKCEITQGEVEALRFEYECYMKRRQEWQLKLKNIRNSISNQTLKSKQIKSKITEIETQLMAPTARSVVPLPN